MLLKEGQRGIERIPSRLCSINTEPYARLKLMHRYVMTWAKINSQTLNQLSHPGAPIFKCLKMFYLFLREKDRARAGEGQREREKHRIWSRFQALNYQHRAQCRAWTHKLRGHDLSQSQMLNRLSHLRAPSPAFLKQKTIVLKFKQVLNDATDIVDWHWLQVRGSFQV